MDVVVVVDGGIVETLQVSPLVRTLAAGLPGVRVTVACPPAAAAVVEHVEGVAEVLPLGTLGSRGGGFLRGLLALRGRRFNAAVVCSASTRAHLLAYFAGVPLRAGLRHGPARILLTHDTEGVPGENRAAAWLRLAPLLDVEHRLNQPAYEPTEAARRVAEERMVGSGFEDGRLMMIAVAPGTGFSDPLPAVSVRAMTWEPERFAHLCNQVSRRHGAGVVVLGTEADRPFVDAMLLDVEGPALDLCAELTDLDQVAAVLARCDLLICGDSPLLHLAAAVGTPSVGLFGPTDGRQRAPYGAEHRVVQAVPQEQPRQRSPRLHNAGASLRQIRVDDVLAGIEAPL